MDEDDIARLYRLLMEFIDRGASGLSNPGEAESAAIDLAMALESRESNE